MRNLFIPDLLLIIGFLYDQNNDLLQLLQIQILLYQNPLINYHLIFLMIVEENS